MHLYILNTFFFKNNFFLCARPGPPFNSSTYSQPHKFIASSLTIRSKRFFYVQILRNLTNKEFSTLLILKIWSQGLKFFKLDNSAFNIVIRKKPISTSVKMLKLILRNSINSKNDVLCWIKDVRFFTFAFIFVTKDAKKNSETPIFKTVGLFLVLSERCIGSAIFNFTILTSDSKQFNSLCSLAILSHICRRKSSHIRAFLNQ